jgi:predicted negative regulator of RcsB-dependent stress response
MRRFLTILLLSATVASACSRMDGSSRWIRQAHQANLDADRAIRRGDTDSARKALVASLEQPVPDTVNPHDSRMVKQDMCFRLSLVEMEEKRPEKALEWARRGLDLGQQQDLFTANLYVAMGSAQEALGREVQAAESYHLALKINETLLNQTLEPEEEKP